MEAQVDELTSDLPEDMSDSDLKLALEAEIAAQLELQRIEKARVQEAQRSLAQAVEGKYADRKAKRSTKEAEWLEAQGLYLGSSAWKSNATSDKPWGTPTLKGRPQEFNVVASKCDTAISVLWSMQFGGGDKNWDIYPTPVPQDQTDAPMDRKMASAASENMESTIWDQLAKCRYPFEARLAMQDRVILGTGIVKSPVNTGEMYTRYSAAQAQGNVVYMPQVQPRERPCARRVNPWFFFPDPTATDIEQAEDAIELHPMSVSQLEKLLSDPSFDPEAIMEALSKGPNMVSDSSAFNFTSLTDNTEAYRNKFQVLEYHGPLTKDQLGNLGLDPVFDSPTERYYAELWTCNGEIIRAELANIEGACHVPYAVCEWKKDPSSIFGIGMPIQLRDPQIVINKTYKMILDNAAISSGPQVVFDKTKITPADAGDWELRPDKIWFNTEYDSDVTKSVHFFTPDNTTQQLTNLLMLVREFATEESALPAIMPGTQSPQNADTAYGTKMTMHASTTVIDFYNELWDDKVTDKVIRGFYAWNMQYNPDPSIKGDFDVDVTSSSDIKGRDIYVNELEKLSVEASQNPEFGFNIDMGELTKARLSMMKLPFKNIVRSPEEAEQARQAAQQNQQPDPAMLQAQAALEKVEVDKQRIQLETQKLQFESTLKMQQAQWDHEEKMGANYARLRESEAQVLAAQLTFQTEMAKLAQKDGAESKKLTLDLVRNQTDVQTQKFLKGIDATLGYEKLAVQREEMKYAKQNGGKGI